MELPNSFTKTAFRMMFCGEIQKPVDHREKEFNACKQSRAVVMEWAFNRKIEDERSLRDPMDCHHGQGPDWVAPIWYL